MIKVLGIDDIDNVIEIDLNDDFSKYKLIWMDCYNPKNEELIKMSKKINIPVSDFIDVLDEQEVPRVEENEDFYLVVYKTPLFEDEEEISTTSLGIFLKDNIVITIHKNKIKSIDRIVNIILEKKPKSIFKNVGHFLYVILSEITRSYSRILLEFEDRLEILEDKILEGFDKAIIEEILELRKTLIYFHKSLIGNRDVLLLLKRKYLPIITKEDKENFEELYYDTLQLIDMTSTFREFLTSMMDTAISLENIKMNQIMKILTMVTTVFAVPMWITGIFGMNFQYMPLINSPEGFWIIFSIMILFLLTIGYIFKKAGWI
ncbi:magnesium/cobalt transporter CorA [Methanocaldococcus indicus]|uniref:magnesium/cobalt transporter CorA n=1 Tax=Methanocaldococcus indicus TaxID=213231 RepID=UPI003C6D9CFA